MKNLLQIAIVALIAIVGPRLKAAEDAVLYWMVNDPIVYEYDETGNQLYVEEVLSRPDGKTVNGARVHVTNAGSSVDVYLTLLNSDYTESSAAYIEVSQTSMGMMGGPAMSTVLSEYQEAGYVFTMELGHWENNEWLVMAVSKGESWDSLQQFTNASDMATPGLTHWAPNAAYVPEPSSGLLIFIGGALLALRRKRAVVASGRKGEGK